MRHAMLAAAAAAASALTVMHAAAGDLRVDPADPDARFASIGAALRSLQSGDTLTIAPGIYREAIDLRPLDHLHDVTIAGDAQRPASIRGSDVVEGWELVSTGLYARRNWRTPTQQLFVDGVPQQQIGGTVFGGYPDDAAHPLARLHASGGGIWPGRVGGDAGSMPKGSFYHDAKAATLYLRPDVPSLEGHLVEASVRPYVLIGDDLRDVVVRDLHFMHSNTTAVSQSGAIALSGERITLERLTVTSMDGNCVDLTGDGHLVREVIASHCGMVGLKLRGRGNRILSNVLSHNNTRGFNKWWEAGGAKFVGAGGLADSEVSGNLVHSNRGDGLWFDWKNARNRIKDNVVAYNEGMGIHYEASDAARIDGNLVFGNTQRGIYLPNSSHSTIEDNLVFANGLEGVAIVDERRAALNGPPEFVPVGNAVARNVLAWNGKAALVLPDPKRDNTSDDNLIVTAGPPRFSLGWGSREAPVQTGLDAWRKFSGEDLHSTATMKPMPARLADALAARELRRDWRRELPAPRVPAER